MSRPSRCTTLMRVPFKYTNREYVLAHRSYQLGSTGTAADARVLVAYHSGFTNCSLLRINIPREAPLLMNIPREAPLLTSIPREAPTSTRIPRKSVLLLMSYEKTSVPPVRMRLIRYEVGRSPHSDIVDPSSGRASRKEGMM